MLRQQHALIQRYWHDANAQVDDFKNEGVVASGSWPFQVNLLQSDKRPIASTIPDEGATGWADTTMMAAGAKHPNCAYLWLEHSLQPKVQGDVAAWFGSLPAVPAACKGNALLTDDGCKTNGYDNFSRSGSGGRRRQVRHQSACVPYSLGRQTISRSSADVDARLTSGETAVDDRRTDLHSAPRVGCETFQRLTSMSLLSTSEAAT